MKVEARSVVWLIPILLTVHNVEEAVAFRRYWPDLPALLPAPVRSIPARVPSEGMVAVLAALSLGVFVLAFIVDRRPTSA